MRVPRDANWVGLILAVLAGLALAALIVMLGMFLVEARAENADLRQQMKSLTTQNRGPAGEDGADATEEQIAAAVAMYCAQRNQCQGEQGIQGVPGERGATGPAGKNGVSVQGPAGVNGSNGLGITSVKCFGTYIRFYAGGNVVGDVSMVCIP